MSYHPAEKRTLACMGCGKGASVTIVRVMEIDRCIGEVFPQHECGSSDWIDLPEVNLPSDQEAWVLMRPALIERGEVVETPYGDMSRDQFHEHARVMNAYYERLGDEMRGFRE